MAENTSSTNTTGLYGGASTPVPNANNDLIVRGDLYVLSGNILTTATTGNIFPANATTVNLGNAATTVNIGANTGTTTVNNDLVVDGDLTINGTFIAPDAEFGNITIAVADDNTITTTTGNLTLTAADNVDIVSNFTSPTRIIRNTPSTNVAVRSLTLAVQSTGTPAAGFGNSLEYEVETAVGNTERAGYISVNSTDVTPGSEDFEMSFGLMTAGAAANSKMLLNNAGDLQIDGDLTVTGNNIKGSGGTTAVTLSGTNVTVAGDLTVTGNDIKSSGGTTAVTLSGSDVAVAGDLTVTGNDIKGSGGTTALTLNAGSVTVADDLTVTGTTVNLAQATEILYSESNNRLNRPVIRSTTGNQSGLRIEAPNATASAIAVSSVFNTNDPNNGKFINIRADGSAGPLSIRTGGYTAGVFGASGNSIDIYDGSTKYATINPAGPTIGTDLTTKTYVDAHPGTTYDIDATSATGGVNFNLNGSDSTTDTIKFTGGSNITITATSANEITFVGSDTDTKYDFNATSTTGGANLNLVGSDSTTDTVKLSDGTGVTVSYVSGTEVSVAIGQPVATTDSVTFADVTANGVVVGSSANTVSGTTLAIDGETAGGGSVTLNATDSTPGGGAGQLTIDTAALTYTHTDGALVPGVTGTWSFNADGTTSFPNYTFPYADGAANQVLTTDGAGNVTWALPGGGGSTFGNVSIGVDTDQTISTTSGNLILQTAAGVNAGTVTLTAGTNGDITVAPNGTGKLVVNTETDTNISDGNYILGAIAASRNTAWTPPTSGLTTISSTNGVSAGSSTGYGAGFQAVYYSGDTTAGTAASANYTGRGASGTNTVPGAAANNQVLVTVNADGYATTGFAQNIATVNSGGGTTPISPAQIQLYAREAFVDTGTTVTNAGVGFRVRGFPTGVSMSTANRVNYIDHSPNDAIYRSDAFTFRLGTSTTYTANLRSNSFNFTNQANTSTYAQFLSSGHSIGGIDSPLSVTRVRGATAGTSPSLQLRNSNTATTTPATGDGTSFRQATAGSSGTFYNLSDIAAQYSSTGDTSLSLAVANGDQTGATFSNLATVITKLSQTSIKAASSVSATPGGNTVTDVAIFTPGTTTIKSDTFAVQSNAGSAYATIDTNKALFSKPVRTTVTTATVAQGGTYTPAATVMNSIVLTITAGAGVTSIDVNNLTVAGENGIYDILIYNNSGGTLGPNDIEIINGVGNIVLQHNANINNGARALFEINCIDIYAGASFMSTAV